MNELTRRRVLAASGVATMGAIAGCTGGSDDETNGDDGAENTGDDDGADGDTDDTQTGSSGTTLGGISIENLHDESHTVDVLVEFDREIEHWTTHSLDESDTGIDVDREWPSEAGTFRVTFRIDGEEIKQVTSEEWTSRDCLSLVVLIRRSGDVRITADTDGGACETGED